MLAMGARVIEDGCMDMIGLGRQFFADPVTPLKLVQGREDEIKYCTQCMNCEELMIHPGSGNYRRVLLHRDWDRILVGNDTRAA